METVRLDKVARFFGARLIFKDVSLALRPGTVTLLAGPNGAGKSTLLKIIAGLIRPSAGQVHVAAAEPGGAQEQREACIGYLGHGTFIYPGMSARENLGFWSALHGMRHSGEDLRAALERMDLGAFAEEKAGGFSRGMSQRLNLARLFLMQPDILLLDEPGTGLDGTSTQYLRREISRAAERGAAVLWITHSPAEDLPLADQVALLENKRLRLVTDTGEYLRTVTEGNRAEAAVSSPPPEFLSLEKGAAKDAAQEEAILGPASAAKAIHTFTGGTDSAPSSSLFQAALAIARKDLLLTLGRGSGLLQAMLLGLLLLFVFSLSMPPGQNMSPEAATAIFWMASAFCQVLIFSTLYAHEEGNQQRHGLLLAPAPVQSAWLGKLLAGGCLLLCAQLLFIPASVIFLAQDVGSDWATGLGILLLADVGIITLGSLLGALSQGQSARESLLSIVLFPLLAPLFLAGIRLGSVTFGADMPVDASSWFGMACAFDAIFLAAALMLFPHVYTAEE